MNEKVFIFREEFTKVVQEAERFCFATRALELQEKQIQILKDFHDKIMNLKKEMIQQGDDDSANACLSLSEMVNILIAELDMWINLKKDNANKAWDALVDAQMHARRAMQAHSFADHLTPVINRLGILEHILFPHQVFASTGLIVKSSHCSICEKPFGDCNHLKGRPYMGELCSEVIEKIGRLDHVAIVEFPSDKSCRIMTIEENGVDRDVMTWRVISN